MRITYKNCCIAAHAATERSEFYEFHCNRRNGYIALDRWTKGGETYYGPLICGTSREVYNFISGGINLGLYLY